MVVQWADSTIDHPRFMRSSTIESVTHDDVQGGDTPDEHEGLGGADFLQAGVPDVGNEVQEAVVDSVDQG